MNLGVQTDSLSRLREENLAAIPELLKQLPLSQVEPELLVHFSREFELLQLDLGQLILIQHTNSHSIDFAPGEQNRADATDLLIVCQGRVRLLAFDAQRQRLVSVKSLEVGDIFGADQLFSSTPLPYQAIAASPTQIARLSHDKVQPWLQQLPDLRDFLEQQTRRREHLIFFKTSTLLRSLPSHQLQHLLPLLAEDRIAAGERLADSHLSQGSHCWLRYGHIASPENTAQVPQIGDSWGYPDPVPSDWLAETELTLYKLPEEHWQAAVAIAPILSQKAVISGVSDATSHATGVKNRGNTGSSPSPLVISQFTPRSISAATKVIPAIHPVAAVAEAERSPELIPEQPEVVFPAPTRQRSRRRFWPSYPFIEQQSTSDCGVACLAMISQYWGKRLSINTLRNLANVGRSGASLKNLAGAAERVGFQTRPVRASLGRLAELDNPWIAHWQGDHYVVVYRTRRHRILIADPAVGKQSLTLEEFQANWTGYALLLEPSERFQSIESEKLSLGRFWSAVLPYHSVLLQIVLASLLLQVFGLVTPLFTQIILDRVIVQKSMAVLNVFVIGLVLFSVWQIGLTAVRQYLLDYFSNRLDLSFISAFINHTLKLPLQFFESRHVGDIITRVQENQKIQLFLTRQAVTAWLNALTAVVYIGLMAYYNWQLTLLVLALLPPIIILTVAASPFLRRISRAIFKEAAAQNSSLVEMISGVATVKATAAEYEMRWLWEDRFTRMLNERFRGQKFALGLQTTSGLINTLGSTLLLWFGARLVIQDQLTIGQFVAFNMLIGNVTGPILALVGLWDECQEVLVSVERLNDVFSTPPEESPRNPMLVLPPLKGEVRFEDITFRYQDTEKNVLQNISLEVQPGQTIAIVGRSGSGKSTFIKLLQGLYHPTTGRIWIDGHDIRHVSPPSLRSQLGVVPQECFLFSGTILENITLFRPEFTLEDVVQVSKLAEAHGFIQDLPLGYNTKVGERGANLSGGQRQRIAIARALLGNPVILLLDEATSSLDTESERRFQQNLARISRDRTTFIIAHRLSTVQHADRILVLDRGVLVEQGTHVELIAERGLYYHLAQQQLNL
ncbi:cysteine peptidase family C39 domain-containing protein [Leptodesmis sichuanensis]|uniref:cysteine peptidase family C39 domain-containing protein n=1 Tax=Leptodesmis sichuanensis TaxID=2906798 RepID=UPI001F27C88F|nr:peptidase domain-containing ABC transporter [Leptodesmis sichuanensis]UIE38738.1 peptidase domain-containing ABC transporter [Leptodesmis sichuanensis A121]